MHLYPCVFLQRRSWVQNLALVLLPMFFSSLLVILQFVINDSLLSGSSYTCGCKCLRCCDTVIAGNGTSFQTCHNATADSPCSAYSNCQVHNSSECGSQYSTNEQAVFCAVDTPAVWPPALQAALLLPALANLGSDALAKLASYNACAPHVSGGNSSGLSLFGGGQDITSDPGAVSSALQQVADVLASAGVVLGTQADVVPTNLLDLSLIAGSPPLGTSGSDASSSGGPFSFSTNVIPRPDASRALPLLYLVPNCSALGSNDLRILQQLSCTLNSSIGIKLQCSSAVPSVRSESVEQVDRSLYCGWSGSDCPNSPAPITTGAPAVIVPDTPAVTTPRRFLLQSGAPANTTTQASDGSGSTAADQMVSAALLAGAPLTETHTAAPATASAAPPAPATATGPSHTVPASYKQQYLPAFDWGSTSESGLDLTLWVNNSDVQATLAPSVQRWSAPVNLATNSFLQLFTDGWSFRLAGTKGFPVPATKFKLDFASLLGPTFYMWIVQLLLPTFVYQMVQERQDGQLLLMRQQGLRQGPYWLALYIWSMLLYAVFMVVFVGFGAAVQLNIFTKNSMAVQIVLYIMWGHMMWAWALWFAASWSSTEAAVLAAIAINIFSGLISNLVIVQFVQSGPYWLAMLLEVVPSFALFRGLWEMAQYAFLADVNGGTGLTWDKLHDPNNGMLMAWLLLGAMTIWAVFMSWWYGEVFGPDGLGVRRHPFFLLGAKLAPGEPRGWDWFYRRRLMLFQRRKPVSDVKQLERPSDTPGKALQQSQSDSDDASEPTRAVPAEALDVVSERLRTESLWRQCVTSCGDAGAAGHSADAPAVMLLGLQKDFGGMGQPQRLAVASLTLSVGRNESLGLLGPNGAGKTTTLRMIQGMMEPTAGQVLVCGMDMATHSSKISDLMGICPQHDVLWGGLTAREHLKLYGRLKGLHGSALDTAVHEGLAGVALLDVADKPCSTYSGGMRRRLSLAMAVVGRPALLLLDEPSTGLDPVSRKLLWKVVQEAGRHSAMVMTTHSMEEAEVLCGRVGIFVSGKLHCIGTARELTARYSSYLLFSISTCVEQEQQARTWILENLSAEANHVYSIGGAQTYELPRSSVTLRKVFSTVDVEKSRGSLKFLDWSVSNATLEQVFVKITREARVIVDGTA
ncbi:MAG: hypothetical protein WDW36_009993 [Sanguina aurantia]